MSEPAPHTQAITPYNPEPPGMTPREFMARFGGSCRTKHVVRLPARRSAWLALGWSILRGRVSFAERRLYPLPDSSELPPELIRLDPWEAGYLYAVAARARLGIVEIGRRHGGSTFLLACANQQVPIWSIDIQPSDDEHLRALLRSKDVGENVELLVGNSQRDPFPEIGEFDLVFVDGGHAYSSCSADLKAFVPRLSPGGHIVLHDSYQGRQIQPAVLDFLEQTPLDFIRSPYIPAAHWHTSHGSIAHLRKPG